MIVRTAIRLAVVAVAATAALVPLPATAVERWYSTGLYPLLQARLTAVTNQVPIALLDLALLAVLGAGVWRFARLRRRAGLLRATGSAAVGLMTAGAIVYLTFLAVWGLNYRRVPLDRKVEFDASRVTPAAVRRLARASVARVNALHPAAHRAVPGDGGLDAAFVAAQRRLGGGAATVTGVPKRSALELYFRWAAIDGMTAPFFLEVILNPDVLPIERPYVLAHEWAHLAGYAHEDEANLVAWLTCLEGDALAQYSGWMAIYGLAAAAVPRDERVAIAAALEAGPRRDLEALRARYLRSAPAVRRVARETYDAYLRANRVEEGAASYGEVIRLILGAGEQHGWAPRAIANGSPAVHR